jgi:peptidyl-prolyl cis-trans isomerase SurA
MVSRAARWLPPLDGRMCLPLKLHSIRAPHFSFRLKPEATAETHSQALKRDAAKLVLNRRRFALLYGLIAAACITACQSKPPASAPAAAVSADTWAVVDGRQITRDEVEKAYRRSRDGSQPLSEEETLAGKLALLNDLIVQDLLIAKAAALKLEVPQNELDTAYENAKKNVPDATYQQELSKRNLTAADMKEGLRRELLTQKVIEQEIAAKVAVSEKEITDFFNANRAQFNIAEESYHIAQIVITPVREAQLANGTGDDATTPQAAVAKVRMLMERLKAGASFRDLAMWYSEDPESAPRGGDMGFLPVSRLKQAPPQLRDAVLNKTPGSVNVATAEGAYTLVLVVAHEPAGQRDLSTPGMRERITETLRGRKEQLTRMAYLTTIRNDAQVNNYLARRLVETKGATAPNLLPSTK